MVKRAATKSKGRQGGRSKSEKGDGRAHLSPPPPPSPSPPSTFLSPHPKRSSFRPGRTSIGPTSSGQNPPHSDPTRLAYPPPPLLPLLPPQHLTPCLLHSSFQPGGASVSGKRGSPQPDGRSPFASRARLLDPRVQLVLTSGHGALTLVQGVTQ